jgi:hypothetical protein
MQLWNESCYGAALFPENTHLSKEIGGLLVRWKHQHQEVSHQLPQQQLKQDRQFVIIGWPQYH